MDTISITEARHRFLEIADHLANHPEEGALVVTKRGKPFLALLSYEFYETLQETLEIVGDRDMMSQFRQSVAEVADGMATPLERIRNRYRKK